MNLATIIGFVLGLGLISYASYAAAADAGLSIMKLWSGISLLIVVGGALAATAIAFKLSARKYCFWSLLFMISVFFSLNDQNLVQIKKKTQRH